MEITRNTIAVTKPAVSNYVIAKRIMDITVSLTALIILLPLFAIVAAAIKLTSKGNAMYWQERVGLDGKIIMFPKFRSMVTDADKLKDKIIAGNDHKNSVTFKMKKDPRVTAVGRIIRKLSIDELPQLWLVLKGDMSLVGPRPALPREVKEYTAAQRERLTVVPGLTCIWQVSGRGDIAFEQQVEMDKEYIEKRSILLDLKLLVLTVPAVLTGKGAY